MALPQKYTPGVAPQGAQNDTGSANKQSKGEDTKTDRHKQGWASIHNITRHLNLRHNLIGNFSDHQKQLTISFAIQQSRLFLEESFLP